MNTTLKIELRSVYGATKAYPVCDTGLTFANMLGTKTLTRSAMRHIMHLGYVVIVVCPFTGREVARYGGQQLDTLCPQITG